MPQLPLRGYLTAAAVYTLFVGRYLYSPEKSGCPKSGYAILFGSFLFTFLFFSVSIACLLNEDMSMILSGFTRNVLSNSMFNDYRKSFDGLGKKKIFTNL